MIEKLTSRQAVRNFSFLMIAVYFVSYLTRVNYSAVIAEIVSAEGVKKSVASLALTGSAITYGLGQLFSGWLGDRIEPKKLVGLGLCITVAMNLSISVCHSVALMIGIWSVNGFAQSLIWPPLVRLMTGFLTDADYRRTCVQVSGGSAFGTTAVYLVSPLLIRVSGWRCVFVASAAVGVLMLLVWLRFCPAMHRESPAVTEKQENTAAPRFHVSVLLLVILACIMLEGMLREGITTWMPSFISESFHLSSSISILTGVVMPIFAILMYNLTGVLYEKLVPHAIRLSAIVFLVGGLAALTMTQFMASSAAVSVILSAVIVGSMHGISLLLTCMVPPYFARHGKVSFISGLLNASTYVGSAISNYGLAYFAEQFGWGSTVYLWSAIAFLGCVLCVLIIRKWTVFSNIDAASV